MMKLAIIAAAFALAGCSAKVRSTNNVQVPHNPDATRTWWVYEDPSGDQHVLLCDAELLRVRGVLCVRYP